MNAKNDCIHNKYNACYAGSSSAQKGNKKNKTSRNAIKWIGYILFCFVFIELGH